VTKCANLQEDDQLLASLSLQFLKVAPFSVFFTTTTQTHTLCQSARCAWAAPRQVWLWKRDCEGYRLILFFMASAFKKI